MKYLSRKILMMLGLLLFMSSQSIGQSKWVPIMMGDITTFVPNSSSVQTIKDYYVPNATVTVNVQGELSGKDDWVGIYRKGTSTAWSNVVAWNWVSKNGTVSLIKDKKPMPAGEYEIRLFFHNSFVLETKYGFSVRDDNNEQYLLQNLDIQMDNHTIVVKDKDDNHKLLMYASKSSFIETNDENLSVENKTFTPTLGGFDIGFTIKNKDDNEHPLKFIIEIPGIHFNSGDKLSVLNTMTYMVPRKRKIPIGEKVNINPTADDENHNSYPKGYSPVIVAHNGTFTVGASIHTTFNKEQIALIQKVEHNSDDSWSFVYKSSEGDGVQDNVGVDGYKAKVLERGGEQDFKISVRFSDPKSDNGKGWIHTLAPYKAFFNNRFPNKHIVQRDTKPILGINFSWFSEEQNSINSDDKLHKRGYADNGHYLVDYKGNHEGHTYAEVLKKVMKNKDYPYKRVIFWGVSGAYYGYETWDENDAVNYPPQFATNIPESIYKILVDINKILTKADIDFGFWWGRSGETPLTEMDGAILKSSQWNPQSIISSNIHGENGASHWNFAKEQLDSAKDLGVKEIGLDAFSNMEVTAQFDYIRKIKQEAPHVKFMQEGVMCDYLHTELSMYLQPNIKWFNKSMLSDFDSKPVLANYLNPNAEIIVWLNKLSYRTNEDQEEDDLDFNNYLDSLTVVQREEVERNQKTKHIEKLRNLGFTPLLEIPDGYIDNIQHTRD